MANERTLAQLLQSVRYNLNDESSVPRWPTAQIYDNLNHAKDRVWSEVRKERADYFLSSRKSTDGTVTILGTSYNTASLQIPSGSSDIAITLPPDFAELRTFRPITSGYEWVPIYLRKVSDQAYRMARAYPDAVAPNVFYGAIVNERTLLLGPKSDTALDTELVYIWQPADLVAGDSLQMPYPLYEAVEAYATAFSFAQDDDPRAALWIQAAKGIVADVIGADVRQTSDPVIAESADIGWA